MDFKVNEEKNMKKCLAKLSKKALYTIGENHGYDLPKKISIDRLAEILEINLLTEFRTAVKFITSYEMVFLFSASKELVEEDLPQILDGNLLSAVSNLDINYLNYFLSMGYCFISIEDGNPVVIFPNEILFNFIETVLKEGEKLAECQSIQLYAMVLTNIYGLYDYKQLIKVFNRHTGSKLKTKDAKEYVIELAKKSELIIADENRVMSPFIDEDDVDLLIQMDTKRPYYFPTIDDIEVYGGSLLNKEAEIVMDKLRVFLIEKVEIYEYCSRKDMETEKVEDILENLLFELVIAARIGHGLFKTLEILDDNFCYFDKTGDFNKFYSYYMELINKTRKWTLKGATYSEIIK